MIEQIESFLRKEINHGLKDIAIFRENDGSYNMFSRYIIKKNKLGTIIVQVLNTSSKMYFNSVRSAVTYCIFDKRNKLYESKRIQDLDNKLVSLDIEITLGNKRFKKAKSVEEKLITLAKLNESKLKKKQFEQELNQYVVDAKLWQDKRFKQK